MDSSPTSFDYRHELRLWLARALVRRLEREQREHEARAEPASQEVA